MNARLLAAVALVGLGCYKGSTRPVAPAAEEIVNASVAVTHTAAVRALTDLGLPLRFTDPASGQIETDFVDISTYRPEAAQYPSSERLVRFRVVVLPYEPGPGSRLAVFGLYAPFRTGLSNTRRGEREVPKDHPAMVIVKRIVEQTKKASEGG